LPASRTCRHATPTPGRCGAPDAGRRAGRGSTTPSGRVTTSAARTRFVSSANTNLAPTPGSVGDAPVKNHIRRREATWRTGSGVPTTPRRCSGMSERPERPERPVLYLVRSERLTPGTLDTEICLSKQEMKQTYQSMRQNPTRTNTNSWRVSDMTNVSADIEREVVSDER